MTGHYEPGRASFDGFLQHLVDVYQLVDDTAFLLRRRHSSTKNHYHHHHRLDRLTLVMVRSDQIKRMNHLPLLVAALINRRCKGSRVNLDDVHCTTLFRDVKRLRVVGGFESPCIIVDVFTGSVYLSLDPLTTITVVVIAEYRIPRDVQRLEA